MSKPAFREADWNEATGYSEDKSVLLGPDGWACYLGEPEDRTWGRDGRGAVAMLNAQAARIATLEAELVQAKSTLKEAADLFIAIQMTDGEEEHRAIVDGAKLAAKIDGATDRVVRSEVTEAGHTAGRCVFCEDPKCGNGCRT